MLRKTISYTDYDDNERTEDFYFNLNKAELVELELSENGGLSRYVERAAQANDTKTLIGIFKDLVLLGYGEKSNDGKRFIKNDELREAFKQTEAYSTLFMELATDNVAASEFVNGLLPAELRENPDKPLGPNDLRDAAAKLAEAKNQQLSK
jgi:hypothetical protein